MKLLHLNNSISKQQQATTSNNQEVTMTILITTCSKRKLTKGGASLEEGVTFKTQDALMDHWQDLVESVPKSEYVEVAKQYQGRGFRQVLHMVQGELNKLFVISAGLGLVRADVAIPGYNFTVSAGSSDARNILPYVTFDAGAWFEAMCNFKYDAGCSAGSYNLEEIFHKAAEDEEYVVLALSRPYLGMLLRELERLHTEDPTQFECLRIIGANLEEIAPYWMFEYIMPYNAHSGGVVGSKIDFAQRATAHFISEVLDTTTQCNALAHAKLVHKKLPAFLQTSTGLTGGGSNGLGVRTKLTDDELIAFIMAEWENCFGAKTRLLYTLRKGRGLSCSVERFAKAFDKVLISKAQATAQDVLMTEVPDA